MRRQEQLVPALSEARQRGEVEQLVRDQRADAEQDDGVREVGAGGLRGKKPLVRQHELPDEHACKVHRRLEAHQLADTAMEDVERLVRVPRQQAERLVFSRKQVQQGEVDHDDNAGAVGKDEEKVPAQREAEEVDEDVQAQIGQHKQRGSVGREGPVGQRQRKSWLPCKPGRNRPDDCTHSSAPRSNLMTPTPGQQRNPLDVDIPSRGARLRSSRSRRCGPAPLPSGLVPPSLPQPPPLPPVSPCLPPVQQGQHRDGEQDEGIVRRHDGSRLEYGVDQLPEVLHLYRVVQKVTVSVSLAQRRRCRGRADRAHKAGQRVPRRALRPETCLRAVHLRKEMAHSRCPGDKMTENRADAGGDSARLRERGFLCWGLNP